VRFRSSRSIAVALVTLATFTDIVAYSIAIPVLPDLGRRLGASPTMIGLLFGAFGVTLLTVSMPMGAVRIVGRKAPMTIGMVALALAALFAVGDRLSLLFAARLSAADGYLGSRLRAAVDLMHPRNAAASTASSCRGRPLR
jgi:MFS family permease